MGVGGLLGTTLRLQQSITNVEARAAEDLVRGTTELLTWQELPMRMTLGAETPPMSRDGMSFRSFNAHHTGVKNIYRVTTTLIGPTVEGRPVINGADFFMSVGDDHLDPGDVVDLACNFGCRRSPKIERWPASNVLRDLGASVLELSTGQNVLPGEFWSIVDFPPISNEPSSVHGQNV